MISNVVFTVFLSAVSAASSYTPVNGACPSGSLVRAASGLSDNEEAYRVSRQVVADEALRTWLAKTNTAFGSTGDLPSIALSSSGGGLRSTLTSAGVVQAFDDRESTSSTSGLFQALTYHAALSGGGWLLASMAGNNYPTISALRDDIWEDGFRNSLLAPGGLLVAIADAKIMIDVSDKEEAGFDTTLVDVYGRLLAWQLLDVGDHGTSTTLSSIASLSSFTSHSVPYPIWTAMGVKVFEGECAPGPNGTLYEMSPFEFGSWDDDVSAFMQTQYLGTSMKNGVPASAQCTTNYDNLGYTMATSANIFYPVCLNAPDITGDDVLTSLGALFDTNNISAQEVLSLADGASSLQNDPIFPLLQPARNISVMIVNDNSADLSTNFPNGTAIVTTYVQTFNQDLELMPTIPPVDVFVAQGLNTRATFFGCDEPEKTTIIYLPNADYTFNSGTSTTKIGCSKDDTNSMITNGNQVAEQGEREGWATCPGCGIMKKAAQSLPAECTACFAEYCFTA
ncbi:acyl transferase/acyl hydrolase/lysophospholipase [Amylocarpus encephaloides]|uniref:Lysophospholipase n=1 Tax=Amylocarpus encephaloides TaxID=45428 RepID=A0A9P7YHU0_9HELO|nr:acyl transferase/acyl hydrolase/lysophospholipase [Amylocarpus encephaloides]